MQEAALVGIGRLGGEITGIKYTPGWTRVTITTKGLEGKEELLRLRNLWTGATSTPYTHVHGTGQATFLMKDRFRWELLIESVVDP